MQEKMKTEFNPGMRVRVTDDSCICDTGTLVWFGELAGWLVRLDKEGWEWSEVYAEMYPHVSVDIGDKGFWWADPEYLEPLTEPSSEIETPTKTDKGVVVVTRRLSYEFEEWCNELIGRGYVVSSSSCYMGVHPQDPDITVSNYTAILIKTK